MAARYRHNYLKFRENVLRSEWLGANMLARAERVKAFAEAHAPFDPDDPDGQHYREAFDVELVKDDERVRGRVSNDNSAALYVEYGRPAGVDKNGRPYPAQERHRTLGSALEAAKG